MTLISVDEALARLLSDAGPLGREQVDIASAAGRVLARPLEALRTHPPFPASAMDGYAVRGSDLKPGLRLAVIGEAPAGLPFDRAVCPGEAVRIFTGSSVPEGADTILIQENARRVGAHTVEVLGVVEQGSHVRGAGLDFIEGDILLEAGRILEPAAVSLAGAANHAAIEVFRRPVVGIIATGSELVPPGSTLEPGQIVSSNNLGVAAIARDNGAWVHDLGIARDEGREIAAKVQQALDLGSDLVVTLGGASVGDHDLVNKVLSSVGMRTDFWKVAMRPGKPLMFGRIGPTHVLGLPGNPVSALVCAYVFMKPLIAALAGRPVATALQTVRLGAPMKANDHRQDYVRARISRDGTSVIATPFDIQDSSMLGLMAKADGLIVREPGAAAASAGSPALFLMIR